MIRELPIDASRLQLIAATAEPAPVWEWVEKGDKRVLSGAQEQDKDTLLPLWEVAVLVPGDEGKAELINVRIAAKEMPRIPAQFAPLPLEGLVCRASVSKGTGKAVQYWSASGIAEVKPGSKPFIGDNKAA